MHKITFQDDELEVEAETGANLRDVAQVEGASIPFGCEQGICGTCLITPVAGADNLSDMEEVERDTLEAMGAEDGQRLACQCTAEGDVVIEGSFS